MYNNNLYIDVFDKEEMEKEYYIIWKSKVLEFLHRIGQNEYSARIRLWEYGVPLSKIELSPSDICLDTGSYNTYIGAYLSTLVNKIYLTDSYEWSKREYIKKENRPLPEDWQSAIEKINNNIIVKEADIVDLPFQNGMFDKVFCFSTIEHVENDSKGLQELWRVLKTGGSLILTTDINTIGFPFAGYGKVYSPETLTALFSSIGIEFPLIQLNNLVKWAYKNFTCISIVVVK